MNTRTFGRLTAALLVGGSATILLAPPASAHVSVSSADASRGGFGLATFRVPNESDSAATTKLTVTLPTDAPFAFVTAQAKPGWTVSVAKKKLDEPVKNGEFEVTEATASITWTADRGGGIPTGQFDTFGISGGPFPDADQLVLPVTQTYADGEVVAWDQEQADGEDEPDKPAPTLALAAASTSGHGAHGGDSEEASPSDGGSSDSVTTAMAGGALVLSAAALALAVRQNRRRG